MSLDTMTGGSICAECIGGSNPRKAHATWMAVSGKPVELGYEGGRVNTPNVGVSINGQAR